MVQYGYWRPFSFKIVLNKATVLNSINYAFVYLWMNGDNNMKRVGLISLFAGILLEILSFSEAFGAGSFMAFGPKDYIRTTQKPATSTDEFSVLDPTASYTLHIYNGGKDDQFKRRASSAVISLNGTQVVGPSELNQNVSHIEKLIELSKENALAVKLRSKPNSDLTIEIIGIDNVPPTIVATPTPLPNAAGWNNTDVTVSFECSDLTSGIASCPGPVLVQQEGANQVITGTATDRAGNTASASATINLDKTPPTIGASLTPFPNAAGWNTSDVTVEFDCSDQLSGVESCQNQVLVTDEGWNQQVRGEVWDRAGNSAEVWASVSLDKTPPDLTVTEPVGAVENSQVTIQGMASDAISGVAAVTCDGTEAVWSAGEFTCTVAVSEGPNDILVEAEDIAGNVSTSTASFVVNSADLELKYIDDFDRVSIYEETGLGWDWYYRPRNIPAGYYSLGAIAPTKDGLPPFAMVVKELKPGALAEPDHWEEVHTGNLFLTPLNWNMCKVYRPIPPPGYTCLGVAIKDRRVSGGHVTGDQNLSPPDNIRCVRNDLITAGRPGDRINSDYYFHLTNTKTTWRVFPENSEGIYTGQIAWSDSQSPPPSGTLKVISADAVRKPVISPTDLIESFGPNITFYPGEWYLPDDPEYLLDNSLLQWGTVQNEWDYASHLENQLGEVETSASTLTADAAFAQSFNSDPPDPSFRTWIKIPEPESGAPHSPEGGAFIRGDLSRARVLVRARAWNTLFTELQFWIYYPFNGPGKFYVNFGILWDDHEHMNTCGRHYSDWEHVSILFESGLPVSMYLSRHDQNVWIFRKDFGFIWDRDVHPVIYAARDSHAHYTTPGSHYYKRVTHEYKWYAATYLDVDLEDISGDGATLETFDPAKYWFVSSDIPGVDPPEPEPDWLQFTGRWGQYEQLSYPYIVPIAFGSDYEYTQEEVGAGPAGPATKTSWQKGDWCVWSDTCQ